MHFKAKLLAILSILTTITLNDSQAQEAKQFMPSGSLVITSDYRYRGVSQTNKDPSLQGSLEWSHTSGWYMGVWGSNISFAGSLETNFFSGIQRQLNEGTVGDIGFLYYHYPASNAGPSTSDTDFFEIYGILSFDEVSPLEDEITIGINLTPEGYNKSGKYYYTYVDYSVSLPQQTSISFHLGYNIWTKSNPGVFGDASKYLDWSASIGLDALGLNWSATLLGSNLKESACGGDGRNCDTGLVFTLAKSF